MFTEIKRRMTQAQKDIFIAQINANWTKLSEAYWTIRDREMQGFIGATESAQARSALQLAMQGCSSMRYQYYMAPVI